ncbi:MAG: polyprenol monophosphomannose synthase [Ignavibacteriae bacterium]|nr:polyprenol monophosphomannose synthase [Ignavibacteria bacterium]MBI3364694.1 polyprenol monophosphomannose synthase [Ignavibacteriota bacterium]
MPKTLVVTPTYNEADNIEQFITDVLKQSPDIQILIVDDNSPDKTGDIVARMMETNSRVHLIRRPYKMGLGTAYVEGFRYAIARHFDYVFEMDADFSHNPDEIPHFLKRMNECDLVLGSRYTNGVRVVNWPIRRLLLSYSANVYTRIVTGMPVKDATGGFKCFKRKVLESINLDNVRSNGYAFQIEMNFKTWSKGFKVCEHPIIFFDRRSGVSKMSKKIVYEAVFMVWKLKLQKIFRKLS